jgi:hypothetical protein
MFYYKVLPYINSLLRRAPIDYIKINFFHLTDQALWPVSIESTNVIDSW